MNACGPNESAHGGGSKTSKILLRAGDGAGAGKTEGGRAMDTGGAGTCGKGEQRPRILSMRGQLGTGCGYLQKPVKGSMVQ